MSFDFCGTYDVVLRPEQIKYTLDDGRKVSIQFSEDNHKTTVSETFEAESVNPVELQKAGWQAILDRFKRHVEEQE